jgi:hypothetical protein
MNIWHVYDVKRLDKSDTCNVDGSAYYVWPAWFIERYSEYRASPSNPELFFTPSSPTEQAFLSDAHENQIPFQRKRIGKWNAKNIDQFPFYQGVQPRADSPIFTEVTNIFENQLGCDWPMSADSAMSSNGCGDGKKQIRKLIEPARGKFPRYAIFNLCLFVRASRFHTGFAVSRKFRDVLLEHQITGIELVPILKNGIAWTAEEMLFDFVNDRILENCEYFQLIITASTAPVRMDIHSKDITLCSVCNNANTGWENVRAPMEIVPANFLNECDFQAEQDIVTVDGVVAKYWLGGRFYISARVVGLIMVESALSLLPFPGKYGKFLPVLIDGEF